MFPTIHLKNEIEPDHMPVTFVNLLNYLVQLAKHGPVGSFQLYLEYHDNQNIHDMEINSDAM